MSNYQTLKKLIVERLPRLRELTMGCEIKKRDGYYRVVCFQEQEDEILYTLSRGLNSKIKGRANIQNNILITPIYLGDEILGHDPTPADLLEVLGEDWNMTPQLGFFRTRDCQVTCGDDVIIDADFFLPRDLRDLDDKTCEILISLITK